MYYFESKYFDKNLISILKRIPGKGKCNACLWTNNKTFLPRMWQARVEAKSNTKNVCVEYQPWNPSAWYPFTRCARDKIALSGKKQNNNNKKHIHFPCPLGSNLSSDFFRKHFVFWETEKLNKRLFDGM